MPPHKLDKKQRGRAPHSLAPASSCSPAATAHHCWTCSSYAVSTTATSPTRLIRHTSAFSVTHHDRPFVEHPPFSAMPCLVSCTRPALHLVFIVCHPRPPWTSFPANFRPSDRSHPILPISMSRKPTSTSSYHYLDRSNPISAASYHSQRILEGADVPCLLHGPFIGHRPSTLVGHYIPISSPVVTVRSLLQY